MKIKIMTGFSSETVRARRQGIIVSKPKEKGAAEIEFYT